MAEPKSATTKAPAGKPPAPSVRPKVVQVIISAAHDGLGNKYPRGTNIAVTDANAEVVALWLKCGQVEVLTP